MTAAGIVIGLLGSFYFARLVSTQLFHIGSFDPMTFASMGFLLLAVSILASYIPARRASRIDPNEACRYE
jgi:putative ABC transport system permease protein